VRARERRSSEVSAKIASSSGSLDIRATFTR